MLGCTAHVFILWRGITCKKSQQCFRRQNVHINFAFSQIHRKNSEYFMTFPRFRKVFLCVLEIQSCRTSASLNIIENSRNA